MCASGAVPFEFCIQTHTWLLSFQHTRSAYRLTAACGPYPDPTQPLPLTRPAAQVTYRVLEKLGRKDSLLDIAMELEKIALQDEYFVKR